jgi:hypothetical protein
MAWRIDSSVVRGEIDNRKRGHVRGKIWLVGREEPVMLELKGNCWRDLAGCIIRFQNPAFKPSDTGRLMTEQRGIAGDITASRKVRVYDVPLEEALVMIKQRETPPEHMANSLYIEWFSQANGRVVIESTVYAVDISTPSWRMSDAEERAQDARAKAAMRDFLQRVGESVPVEPGDDETNDAPEDEFEWEKFLKESDARTEKYGELLERYGDNPDAERLIAREMGWSWVEDALDAEARGALPAGEPVEVEPLVPEPHTEGINWTRDEDGRVHHPLCKRTFDTSVELWNYCKERGLLGENADIDLMEMVSQYQATSAKLAGALNTLAYGEDRREGGFIVALLKRALVFLNRSIEATQKIATKNLLDANRINTFRKEQFQVREEILQLMDRFRGSAA